MQIHEYVEGDGSLETAAERDFEPFEFEDATEELKANGDPEGEYEGVAT